MNAQPGNRIILEGTHLGEPRRIGVIVEVHGANGAPPYLVRWLDDDHETLLFPGPDAHIEPAAQHI
jgi:hypothetical protein